MARTNKLYEKTRATTIAADDLLTIGQLQQYGEYKVKTITRANEALETLTYAQLEAKVTASTLVAGKWYKITNATSANFNLLVQAIAVNKIGCDAKDPLYPNDVVKYNFASNVITWRWDTVNDISAGEDWRNSVDIQIGSGCSHIEIGKNCEVIIGQNCSQIKIGNNSLVDIGENCRNIEVGNDCDNQTLTIEAECERIKVGDGCLSLLVANGSVNLEIGNNCEVNFSSDSRNSTIGDFSVISANSIQDVTMGTNCNIVLSSTGGNLVSCQLGNNVNISLNVANKQISQSFFGSSVGIQANNNIQDLIAYSSADLTTATFVYNLAQSKTIQKGNADEIRLIYLDNTNTLVNVNAEA